MSRIGLCYVLRATRTVEKGILFFVLIVHPGMFTCAWVTMVGVTIQTIATGVAVVAALRLGFFDPEQPVRLVAVDVMFHAALASSDL